MAPYIEKIVKQGLDSYWKRPVSHASIPPRKHSPPPDPIEPVGWWEGCWFNPFKKGDIYGYDQTKISTL